MIGREEERKEMLVPSLAYRATLRTQSASAPVRTELKSIDGDENAGLLSPSCPIDHYRLALEWKPRV